MTTKTHSDGMDPKDEIKICKVCKLTFDNIYAYTEHLEGREHHKVVMKKKYGKKYLAAKADLDEKKLVETFETPDKMLGTTDKNDQHDEEVPKVVENVKSSGSSSAKDISISEDDSDDAEVYTCETCQKICTGFLAYQLHLQGKKHQKTVKKVTLLKEMKELKLIPETNSVPEEDNLLYQLFPQSKDISSNLECKTCKKKCMGPEAYKMHCKSASHQKKVAMEELLKGMETEGLSPTKDDEDGAAFAHCDLCNKAFSGPVPYMQHMKSTAHVKQELRKDQLGKIQNLIISKEEDSKFNCKECGRMFSGPIPFNNHLKSSAHSKKIKKNALIENLEKKYPDLVKTFVVENCNGSDEDDGIQLGCKICRVVFSGPEAANDHFTSNKHKKAKQKKTIFKKFQQQQKTRKLSAISGGEKKGTKSDSEDSSEFEEEFDIIKQS